MNAIVEGGGTIIAGENVNVDAYEKIKVTVVDGAVAVGFVGAGAAVTVLNVTSTVLEGAYSSLWARKSRLASMSRTAWENVKC